MPGTESASDDATEAERQLSDRHLRTISDELGRSLEPDA